ncbi:MAG: hypothetical protein NTY48_02760 [Candidatus Diapherotrites archaeon]|nr:hypothetical protein [Candidatus Diapherotrites archaeon]
MKDTKYALLCVGSVIGTAKETVDELRAQGKKVGLVKLKSVRPMPVKELKKACEKLKGIGVIDKHASLGFGGALTNDIKSALAGEKVSVTGFVAGLGGRDIDRVRLKKAFSILEKGEEGCWLR